MGEVWGLWDYSVCEYITQYFEKSIALHKTVNPSANSGHNLLMMHAD